MLEKFVRISGIHTGIRRSKQLWCSDGVVNNNFIIKFMQYKDTSQHAFLIIYFI